MLHFFQKCYIFQNISSTVGRGACGAFPSLALLCFALPVPFLSVTGGGLSSPATQVPRTPILQHRPVPLGPTYPPARRSLHGRAAAMKFAPGAKKTYSRPYRYVAVALRLLLHHGRAQAVVRGIATMHLEGVAASPVGEAGLAQLLSLLDGEQAAPMVGDLVQHAVVWHL